MFRIRVAEILMQINNRYDYIREKCSDYIVEEDRDPEIIMEPSEDRIQYSIDYKWRYDQEKISISEAEYDAAPYTIYHLLPEFDAFWLHAAVVEMDGKAYAFSAAPGYGKSTHVNLWKKVFGDKVRIINGDNPIIRLQDGVFYAYGTPFCGKEGYQENIGVPLKGICFLKRASENRIQRVAPASAYVRLLRDNYNITPETMEMHMKLYERLIEQVPVYSLHCNMADEAAIIAWEGMKCDE